MSASKFKFVSPGIFINEIDNSERPRLPGAVGPVIIGRSEKGPGMRPVKVESFSDFLEVFGAPIPGGSADDVSRNGNYTAPTYAAFAAQAYLRNSNPITFVRLLGEQHSSATAAGVAGWKIANPTDLETEVQGAYGLFLIKKNGDYTTGASRGVLAGILYTGSTASATSSYRIAAGGTNTASTIYPGGQYDAGGAVYKTSISQAIISTAGGNFTLCLRNESPLPGTVVKTFTVNFDKNSGNYIRKVLNTNPTLTNASVTPAAALEYYWLGPTFERNIESLGLDATAGNMAIAIVPLAGNGIEGGDFERTSAPGTTPWVFSQITGANADTTASAALIETAGSELSVTKLFRMVGLHSGQWESKNLKVSVQDVKESTTDYEKYGTFSIVVRQSSDTDANPKIIERFSGLNLNPDSPDYIARRIGDMKSEWDYSERRYIEQGNFENNSSYFRVEVSEQVTSGLASGLLPMGFYGPLKFQDLNQPAGNPSQGIAAGTAGSSVLGDLGNVHDHIAGTMDIGPSTFQCDIITLPSHPLRASAADSKLKDPTDAYFGIEAHYSGSSRQADDYGDLCLPVPGDKDITHATTQHSFLFTLQDLVAGTSGATYTAGAYAGSTSIDGAGSTFDVLSAGYDRFTMPVVGGFDGVDIAEQDPFRNSLLSGGTEINNYAYNSVRRAIDSVSDEEVVECDIITTPGLTDPTLTSHMIDVCERRGDALAIIDIQNDYTPVHESSDASDASSRNPSVSNAVASLKTRGINSSYGAAYFPFVKVRDDASGKIIDCPPSVVALGTMGSSARKTELWFAPAGFTRGGLSTGSAGLPVTGVRLRLTSKERDKLYEHNINPIASFPSEGIVIFGQKTLQATPSALDRINVRRLMIFLKREISRMAATVLFDQNVKTTWARFSSKVEPFLASVRTRFGLSEYRLILDETTTTAELVDRNVMYAKVLLKPARAIEYIAIDFVITDSGASFSE